jgi:S-layer homology domain
MSRRLLAIASLLISSLSLSPAEATTVAAPTNLGRLARASQTVTFAEAVESWVEGGETIPFTVTRFHRLEAVSGASTGDVFEVREPGGRLADKAAAVAGAPRFVAGKHYLLFLDRAPGGRWQSKMMAYGLLEELAGDLLRPIPEAEKIEVLSLDKVRGVEPVGVYRKTALFAHLREVALGAAWDGQKVAADPLGQALLAAPQSCVFLTDGGDNLPMRWFGFETGARTVSVMATTPGQTGIADGGVSAVQQGLAAWTNHSDSVIRYTYGGTRARTVTCSANFDIDQGAVIFNDPCSDIADLAGCSGTLAFGGSFYDPGSTQVQDGQPWHPINSTFVVVNNGAQCVGETGFKETLTHELGHTMGFGHHNPPNPADATMSAFLKNDGRGAAIAIVDKRCASFDYHTFLDVPSSYWAWRWIEGIENAGVNTVCSSGNYCPDASMTRAEMAIFLLRAKNGASYVPPACTAPMFADVPCSSSYAPWINELVRRGVTAGCGGGNYCPSSAVTRSQMAVFLLATFQGTGYVPPACTSAVFSDMPCSSPFAPWVNELVRRGVTAGCGAGQYCPNNVVTRAQMAVFLSTTFGEPVPPAP